jgi:Tfp pilus assembly protein PilZ
MLLWFDVNGLWGLISKDKAALLAVFILWFFNGALFAAVQFGYAVMNQAERPDRSGGCGVLVPVRAAARHGARSDR